MLNLDTSGTADENDTPDVYGSKTTDQTTFPKVNRRK